MSIDHETGHSKLALVSLATIIILQVVMLLSLYAQVQPHPPATIPISGIAPFLGFALSMAVSSIILGPTENRAGMTTAILAALASLVSFGPQKYFDPQFPLVWPAVISAQIACMVLVISIFRERSQTQTDLDADKDNRLKSDLIAGGTHG